MQYDSDITRLKLDGHATALAARFNLGGNFTLENTDVLAITNATLLTFDTGHFSTDHISRGILLAKAGVISQVGLADDVRIPQGAHVIDAGGGGKLNYLSVWRWLFIIYPFQSSPDARIHRCSCTLEWIRRATSHKVMGA